MSQEPNGELRKQSRLQTIVSAALLFVPLFGFIWGQSIEIKSNTDAIRIISTQSQQSLDERKQLQKQTEDLKALMALINERIIAIEEKLKEVDTQFDAIEQRSNNIRNEQVRWLSEDSRTRSVSSGSVF